jgi:hypothetical protein
MTLSKRAESLTGSHGSPTWQKTTTAIANRMLNPVILPAEAATSRPPGTPTRTRHRRFGSTRWFISVYPRSAASSPRPSPASSTAAHLEEVADDFGLGIDAVRWAQSYELSQRACAAA